MIKEIYIKDLLTDKNVGKEVKINGWIYRKREQKDKIFIVLRDSTDIIQCVVHKEKVDENIWKKALEFQIEGSLEVSGILRKDNRAPTGYEIEVIEIKDFDIGKPFPLKGDETTEAIQKYRHLWIRSRKFTAITKVKHSLLNNLREWFIKDNWIEVHPPIIVGNACEDTTTLFEINYFGKKAYLSQSAQLYLEALIYSLEKVFSLTPSFRAEKSRTKRHLHEYWHFEIEAAWMNLDNLIEVTEKSLKFSIEKTLNEREKEFKVLNRDTLKLKKVIDENWIKIKYSEAIDILQKKGVNIEYGQDLGADEEKELMLQFEVPVFLTYYPREIKAFYMYETGDGTVRNFDLLAPEGYGEIIGGSEREWRFDILKKKVKEWNLEKLQVEIGTSKVSIKKNDELQIVEQPLTIYAYQWYEDLRKFGSVPHSGWGLGIERFTTWICKLDHIRDTLPFPRLREGWLYP